MFESRAPGKLILTGEHAVVYGAPALAVAVEEYTHIRFKPITESKTVNTFFSGISSGNRYPLEVFEQIKAKLDQRFEQFKAGELPIRRVLSQPDDLLIYTVSTLLKFFPVPGRPNLKSYLPMPGQLSGDSNLPIGAGMGSSASAIAATLVLYEHILEKPLTKLQRYRLVNTCERLQHGKSSGIDAATVTYGGFVHSHHGNITHPTLTLDDNWYRIDTGKPRATTGQCVSYVREHFGHNNSLWRDFSELTQSFITQLITPNIQEITHLIRENHRLLCRIGVVPDAVKTLIAQIEHLGGAAKISGAGSVTGTSGGMVLAYLPHNIANKLNIHCEPISVDYTGATFLD